MSDSEIQTTLNNIRDIAIAIEPTEPIRASADPDDDKFLACAVAGKADCIASGDVHLLTLGHFRDIPILTPAAFLRWLDHPAHAE